MVEEHVLNYLAYQTLYNRRFLEQNKSGITGLCVFLSFNKKKTSIRA